MINRNLLISFALLFLIGSVAFIGLFKKDPPPYTPRNINSYFASQGFNDAAEWVFNRKKNQVTGLIDHRDVLEARKEALLMPTAKGNTSLATMSWVESGPDNMGGRTRAIVIDKNNSNILYTAGVAGGIFKSVTAGSSWVKIDDFAENLAVSCMAQCPVTGHIYAGTGEGLANPNANPTGGTAFIGKGIFKSTNGSTFSLLPNTEPIVENNSSAEWATINEIAVDEQGWVYAATNKGLRLSKDGGATWENPLSPTSLNATDVSIVKVGSNKTVVASIGNRCYISSTGDSDYVNHSTGQTGKLPAGGVSRIEFAVAPSNPNIIYACAAKTNGNLLNIYRSSDKGETWTIIGEGGTTTFEPLRTQGWYNNTIAVFPNNPNKVVLGGIDLWTWELGEHWIQRTLWFLEETNPYYIHADIHKIVFDPSDPNTFYVGSDGGVSRSSDGGMTFQTINKNLNTIQFYAIAASPVGEVMGGTQDNGTIYISKQGNTVMAGKGVMGGDGGYSAFSIINPNVMFATTYYAGMGRSIDKGIVFHEADDPSNPFFSQRLLDLGGTTNPPGSGGYPASFVTPLLHWETFNDIYSPDSVVFQALDTTYQAGDVVKVLSKNGFLFDYTLPQSLNDGESIKIKDMIQSRFYIGLNDAVWMTREALDFAIQPDWFKVASFSGQSIVMSVSKCGNYLFVGTSNGSIYRISNLRHAHDSLSADVTSPYCVVETKLINGGLPSGRVPTGIAIDPNDPNHVVVTFGNYANTNYVYRSTNALDANPTFTTRQGNLPKMPIYTAIIEMQNSNTVLVGTEYGVFATENINSPQPVWVSVNTGLANVPVYMLVQQVYDYPGVINYGIIYAGTHGRGAFESYTFMSANNQQNNTIHAQPNISLYPNPASDIVNLNFTLNAAARTFVKVYDIRGALVANFELNDVKKGNNDFSFDCSGFNKGSYIVQLVSGQQRLTSKFIVY
ncbi:MAG: T9SS type A sorting domain-containing protein [Bacteroidales bacterium]|nr:T9SS type A sorting domain-containing protein [Bacteroidales bacterium]